MIKFRLYKNGFSWPIILTEKGWIWGEIKIFSFKGRLRVLRKIFLIPKRNKKDSLNEIFVEYYSPKDFLLIIDNAYNILSFYLNNISPIDMVCRNIESLASSLNLLKEYLEEINYGGK